VLFDSSKFDDSILRYREKQEDKLHETLESCRIPLDFPILNSLSISEYFPSELHRLSKVDIRDNGDIYILRDDIRVWDYIFLHGVPDNE